MSDNWYYSTGQEQRGPVTFDALRQLLASGELNAHTLVWTDGMPQWSAAISVPLLGLASAPPPNMSAPNAAPPLGYAAPWIAPLQYYTPETLVQPAGFWKRFVAYVVDAFVIGIPIFAVFAVIDLVIGEDPFANVPVSTAGKVLETVEGILNFVLTWLYFALLESGAKQATLGKRAMGLMVTDVAGQRIGFGRATGRYFAKIISAIILCIGFIMIAFTQRKQGLHDMIASTLVVKRTS